MSKRLDSDIKALRACVRALDRSSSPRMLKANVEYLYDRYVRNPPRVRDASEQRFDRSTR